MLNITIPVRGMISVFVVASLAGAAHAEVVLPPSPTLPAVPVPPSSRANRVIEDRQAPSFQSVKLILIERGHTIWNHALRIGGWATSKMSLSEPTGETVICRDGMSPKANMQRIEVSITSARFSPGPDGYSITVVYSRPEGRDTCFNSVGRSITLQ